MPDWEQFQKELIAWFEARQLRVAVGLKPDSGGLTIRSQDEYVDASNLGQVNAQEAS